MTNTDFEPWTIDIYLENASVTSDGHVSVVAESVLHRDNLNKHLPNWTRQQARDIRQWAADILGRLGIAIQDDLIDTRAKHQCKPHNAFDFNGTGLDYCSVSGSTLVDPDSDYSNPVSLFFTVPRYEEVAWRERIQATLARIISADARPTDEDGWFEPLPQTPTTEASP